MVETMLLFMQAALPIFALRIVDISFYTMRLMMLRRGRKGLTWIFAFCQSFVFVIAIRSVLTDLGNWGKVIGYATGFATGVVVGIWVEERLAIGHTHLRIISSRRGTEISERLRGLGYAVTEVPARGQDGMVTLLNCNVLRRRARDVEGIVAEIDPDAFVTAEYVYPVQRGFWHK